MYRTNGQRSHGTSFDLLGLSPELYVKKKKKKKKMGARETILCTCSLMLLARKWVMSSGSSYSSAVNEPTFSFVWHYEI